MLVLTYTLKYGGGVNQINNVSGFATVIHISWINFRVKLRSALFPSSFNAAKYIFFEEFLDNLYSTIFRMCLITFVE